MPRYRLSDIRTRTSQLVSSNSVSLHSILDSSPEPTTTASGIVPGQAPFDSPALVAEVVPELEESTRRYSQRVRISTEKIGPHNEEVAALNIKRKNRKPRKKTSTGSLNSEQSTTTIYASDAESSHPGDVDAGVHSSTGQPTEGSGGEADPGVHRPSSDAQLLLPSSADRIQRLHVRAGEVSREHDATAGDTPGPETDVWDFSADHERLEAQLTHLADTDPEELAQISPRNLKAIIQEVLEDRKLRLQAREVQPPKLKAQAKPVTSDPIAVGGGHHLDQSHLNRPGSSYRNIEPENTDTEPETEPEHEAQTTKCIASNPNLVTNSTNRPSNPSPPDAHLPINPHIRYNPNDTSGTTQGSTIRNSSVNRTSQLTRTSLSRTPSLSRRRQAAPPAPITAPTNRLPPHVPSPSPRSGDQTRPPSTTRQGNSAGPVPRPPTMRQATAPSTSSTNVSRVRQASKAPEPRLRLPPAVTNALNLANTRQRLRREHERRVQERQSQSSNDPPTPNNSPAPTPSPPELMEDDEEERLTAEANANGQDMKRGRKKKPAARDVHRNERQVLTTAKLHLFAFLIVEGAYQTRGLVTRWSSPVYELTWGQEFPDLPLEPVSKRGVQVMVNSQPTYRGKARDSVRPLAQFRFGFKKPALTAEAIEHNQNLFNKLHPNTFHCLECDPPYGHYENEIVAEAIAVVLFATPTAVGVAFRDYFEPMPLTAVAFVLANLQFCIEEYETGQYQARELNASDMLNKYVAHLRGLKAAQLAARGRFTRLAKDWFDFGFDYSGAMELDDPFTQTVTNAGDVRPDTPTGDEENENENGYLPEAEPEGEESETEEAARYTKCAKGKARA